eukprot:3904725-Rhodomonas_salina.3
MKQHQHRHQHQQHRQRQHQAGGGGHTEHRARPAVVLLSSPRRLHSHRPAWSAASCRSYALGTTATDLRPPQRLSHRRQLRSPHRAPHDVSLGLPHVRVRGATLRYDMRSALRLMAQCTWDSAVVYDEPETGTTKRVVRVSALSKQLSPTCTGSNYPSTQARSPLANLGAGTRMSRQSPLPVSYTHLRAHETEADL